MFEKKNNIKKVDIKKANLYRNDNLLISSSYINMVSEKHNKKKMKEQSIYQNDITSYYNKRNEFKENKEYNPTIVNLYRNGILIINNEEYKLKNFFIVFDDKLNNFHLKCTDKRLNIESIDYNKAVKFIDTTAFINLINCSKIIDNKIFIDSINSLIDIINKWDGYLHSETNETDAIFEKKMIRDDTNG